MNTLRFYGFHEVSDWSTIWRLHVSGRLVSTTTGSLEVIGVYQSDMTASELAGVAGVELKREQPGPIFGTKTCESKTQRLVNSKQSQNLQATTRQRSSSNHVFVMLAAGTDFHFTNLQ